MIMSRAGRSCLPRRSPWASRDAYFYSCVQLDAPATHVLKRQLRFRTFKTSRCLRDQQKAGSNESFGTRLGKAWRGTKIAWYPIPVGLGIGFLGFAQFWRVRAREQERQRSAIAASVGGGEDGGEGGPGRPRKRERIRPSGPWQVQIMSTLPLKAVSRLWGRFNELSIPYYLRVPGFKLYGWLFGVNFDEVSEPDLHVYPNLASFFYRTLKPGVRLLDPNPNAILSPADGRILSFGTIEHGEVEQVKGMTYSLDALLGKTPPGTSPNPSAPSSIFAPPTSTDSAQSKLTDDATADTMTADQEFANMNGISYTLPNLFSGQHGEAGASSITLPSDASTTPRASSEAEVRADLALSPSTQQPWWSPFSSCSASASKSSQLYYVVVYLAPGDYHRFHSPVPWVCTSRRHFAGELYSVSPYLQRTLPGLFTLNERVVLLGRWKYGFFSYTPVGATNVGSIKINFDSELRTNSLTTDTAADRDAAAAKERGEPYSGFSEATYAKASKVLGGHALRRGEEMGGFQLGSSIVLVFEAPEGRRAKSLDEGGLDGGEKRGGWRWNVYKGQRVKMGEAVGWVEEDKDE
jgi:phosphatidylserine decarboxylase